MIDTRPDKKLNDKKVAQLTNNNLKVFYLNVASLITSADQMSLDTEAAHDQLCAMLYYNLATTAVLAGPGLGIVVW